ncbi:MAG: tRNA lysidine(34) synthetase TilS [Alphaproteobacteria bacterium]|nr:tRNA lysidine(34) synthetase TilS [Alphaproteobacteria bacterium]
MQVTGSNLAAHFDACLARALFPSQPGAAPLRLAVALSGGADSLALTLLTQAWAARHGAQLVALTVDHRLRDNSTAEAHAVAQQMAAHGIAHHILTPAHVPVSGNMQETARSWRYAALAEACVTHGILHCLVAHTAGDNRETAAHNLARGATADGASGMRCVRTLHGVRFLRPLLAVERATLEAYLTGRGVAWMNDPSNDNPRFARVRTRAALRDDAAKRAALDAILAQQSAARTGRDAALAEAAIRCVTLSPLGFADLNLAAWRALEPTLASQLLADTLTTISGAAHRPRGGDTARLIAALAQGDGRRRTLHGCELGAQQGVVRIAREAARVEAAITLRGRGETRWDNRFHVRYALPGDVAITLRALGSDGRQQARAAAAIAGEARPAPLPLATPSLWQGETLVAIPHLLARGEGGWPVQLGFAPAKPLAAAPFW